MKDRIIRNTYDKVFNEIDKLLLKKSSPCIVAIDGMCGAGKSHLANQIAKAYECNVFHMDDYFLTLEMKTEERLSEPGGNVHYERFKEEVIAPLLEGHTVIYRPYLCGAWIFDEPRTIYPKRLNIIEGSYSMHPHLRKAYNLSIFLEVDEAEQLRRISQRNGKNNLQQFIDKWIPLENKYFAELSIKSQCDIILK